MDENVHSKVLLLEIKKALESIEYGSLEIIVQNGVVTQITVRNITKTSLTVNKKPVLQNNNPQDLFYGQKK